MRLMDRVGFGPHRPFREYEWALLERVLKFLSSKDATIFESHRMNTLRIRRYAEARIVHIVQIAAEATKFTGSDAQCCIATANIGSGDNDCTANLMVYAGLLSSIEFTAKPTKLTLERIAAADVVIRPEEYLDVTRMIHREEHEEV